MALGDRSSGRGLSQEVGAIMSEINGFIKESWSSCRGTVETNPTRKHEDVGSFPSLLSGLTIPHCGELWYRSKIQLRSHVTVAVG